RGQVPSETYQRQSIAVGLRTPTNTGEGNQEPAASSAFLRTEADVSVNDYKNARHVALLDVHSTPPC
ncbi:hypothetical protein SK128_028140, partial [Halocaridina rubra]